MEKPKRQAGAGGSRSVQADANRLESMVNQLEGAGTPGFEKGQLVRVTGRRGIKALRIIAVRGAPR